ncbi:hypothetical protein [Bacillus subtilis]|uniref:hypothetical protein n=1 Tax=Bacillus subtilis TaxID=1423 RepID=UPI00403F6C01
MSIEFYNYLIKLNEHERRKKYANTLAVEVREFEKRWRNFACEFQFPYEEITTNLDNNILQIKLLNNNNIAFVGDIVEYNDEIILKSVTMIASGDGTPKLGADMFIAIGILVACFNPNEDVEFRNKLFKDLGIFETEIGMKNAIIMNDFKYSINLSKEMGLWFSISRNN